MSGINAFWFMIVAGVLLSSWSLVRGGSRDGIAMTVSVVIGADLALVIAVLLVAGLLGGIAFDPLLVIASTTTALAALVCVVLVERDLCSRRGSEQLA